MKDRTSAEWIKYLNLKPHPEGGYYREIYRAEGEIPKSSLANSHKGSRNYSTSIYYLLQGRDTSRFHRIASDEQWIHVAGTDLTVYAIDPEGKCHRFNLGKSQDHEPFCVLPAGWWFGAKPVNKESFTLAVCTVAPGFDFEDFEMGSRQELVSQFPKCRNIIKDLT